MSDNPKFHEIQQFRQLLLWILILSVSLFLLGHFAIGVVEPLLSGRSEEYGPSTFAIVVRSISVLIGIGLPLLVYKIKMITEITDEGLDIYFSPFKQEVIAFKDIVNFEARTYNVFPEYGGWGIRLGPSGHAYNVSGNQGVQLELADGKKLLIGSQRSEELAQAIQAYKK